VRQAASLLLLVGVGLIVALPAWGVAAKQQAKIFAPGCWKGTGHGFLGSKSPAAGLKFNINKSSLTFRLLVTKDNAVGSLEMAGHGGGEATVSGVTATVEMQVSGNLALSGKPSKVAADGDVDYKGAIVVAGTTQELNFTTPVDALPLTIKTATPTKVTGTVGNATWSAVRAGSTFKSCAP